MMKMNIREAREHFRSLLNQVEEGDEVTLTRRGKIIARIVPPDRKQKERLPLLGVFRASLPTKGTSLSRIVIKNRRRERF